MYTFLFEYLFSFLLGIYLRVEPRSYGNSVFKFLQNHHPFFCAHAEDTRVCVCVCTHNTSLLILHQVLPVPSETVPASGTRTNIYSSLYAQYLTLCSAYNEGLIYVCLWA